VSIGVDLISISANVLVKKMSKVTISNRIYRSLSVFGWLERYVGSCIPAYCMCDKLTLCSCFVMFLTWHLYHLATLQTTQYYEINISLPQLFFVLSFGNHDVVVLSSLWFIYFVLIMWSLENSGLNNLEFSREINKIWSRIELSLFEWFILNYQRSINLFTIS
jgi:hypothetical protein